MPGLQAEWAVKPASETTAADERRYIPNFALTSLMLGLVSADPSANFSVGTVWFPPFADMTNSAAAGSCSMSTSVNEIPDAFSAVLSLTQ